MGDFDFGRELREAIAESRKEISIGLVFKAVTLELSAQQFSSLLDETAAAFSRRVIAIYDSQRSAKGASIGGIDPLETKGVSIGLGFRA